MADVVRSSHHLHHRQDASCRKGHAEPAARCHARHRPQDEIAGQEAERGGGVAGRKATARPSVGAADEPVRDVGGGAAEFGERPRAAGQAGELQQRNEEGAGDRGQHPGEALVARQAARERQGLPDSHDEHQRDRPGQPACSRMQHGRHEPLVAQGEAAAVGEEAGDRQIQAEKIPRDQQRQASAEEEQVALPLGERGDRCCRGSVRGADGRLNFNQLTCLARLQGDAAAPLKSPASGAVNCKLLQPSTRSHAGS